METNYQEYGYVNVSESFDICYNLRNSDSTLGNNSLDPHLTTSLDWGAVLYLAQSRYGINSNAIASNTTGNQSGIRDMNQFTQTATIFESRNKTSTYAISYRYRLEEAVNDPTLKKYVDVIPNETTIQSTLGRALLETKNWYTSEYTVYNSNNTDNPIITRNGSAFSVGPQRIWYSRKQYEWC